MTRTNFVLAGFLVGTVVGLGYNLLTLDAPPPRKSCCPAPGAAHEEAAPVDEGAATTELVPATDAEVQFAAGRVSLKKADWLAAGPAFEKAALKAPTNRLYAAYAARARLEKKRAVDGKAAPSRGPTPIDVKKLVGTR